MKVVLWLRTRPAVRRAYIMLARVHLAQGRGFPAYKCFRCKILYLCPPQPPFRFDFTLRCPAGHRHPKRFARYCRWRPPLK